MRYRSRRLCFASGARSPQPGAPYTYVTTKNLLSQFGLDTLRQLPDFEALEDAGLLSKEKLFGGTFRQDWLAGRAMPKKGRRTMSLRTRCRERALSRCDQRDRR